MTSELSDPARPSQTVTTTASWAPERLVDPNRAHQLIVSAFPQLRGQPVRALAEGWDNSVFQVGDDLVFRFPRRAMALPGVRREIAVLPALAPLLPLSIPAPSYVGLDGHAEGSWPFFGTRLVPGTELASSGLPDDSRRPAAAAVGTFLRSLHAPTTLATVQAATTEPLPNDPMHRAWPRARIVDTRHLLDELRRAGAWNLDVRVERLLEKAIELDKPTSNPVLLHGDLHIRHLLVDLAAQGASATGIIDWGDLCVGDPAVDLSVGYAAFAGKARQAFLDAYGNIDEERELRARALAIRLSATLAVYARATQQEKLAAEALRGLHRAVN